MSEKINDEKLNDVLGGYGGTKNKTNGAVKIVLPPVFQNASGYYTKESLESTLNHYASFKDVIKTLMNDTCRQQIKELYGDDPMPDIVRYIIG